MRTIISILLIVVVSESAFSTEQQPDILIYNELKLSLETGWGHPSPLETYYHQKSIQYPFTMLSTANYRGHIAVWKIYEGKFYLAEIHVVKSKYKPQYFKVKSDHSQQQKNNEVWADWFSGILHCRLKGKYTSYYFHIRGGEIVDSQVITRQDIDMIRSASKEGEIPDELELKQNILTLNSNYITYYYRLGKDDSVTYKQQSCVLHASLRKLSPIYSLYDNSHLKWPYNWENLERSGAPHCTWRIEDNKLYLVDLQLYIDTSFSSPKTEVIELTTLFKDEVQNGVVYADWVSGLYLVMHGQGVEDKNLPGYKHFQASQLTYIRIKSGKLIESHTVPSDFDVNNAPDDIDPRLKQIINEYGCNT
jgi:hypothetical protein